MPRKPSGTRIALPRCSPSTALVIINDKMSAHKYAVDLDAELEQMIQSGVIEVDSDGLSMPGQPTETSTKHGGSSTTNSSPVPSVSPWMWEDSNDSMENLRNLFQIIDRYDNNSNDEAAAATSEAGSVPTPDARAGGISSTELSHMLSNLGEDVPEGLADEMIDLVVCTHPPQHFFLFDCGCCCAWSCHAVAASVVTFGNFIAGLASWGDDRTGCRRLTGN